MAHWPSSAGPTAHFALAVQRAMPLGSPLTQTLGSTPHMSPQVRLKEDMLELLGLRLRAFFPKNEHENPAVWLSQTFEQVRQAILAGDAAAVSLACELIEKDPMLPFGKLIKSNMARALKKKVGLLVASERTQILGATVKLTAVRLNVEQNQLLGVV
jgi:hypothetical protein